MPQVNEEEYWDALSSEYDNIYDNTWSKKEDGQLGRWLCRAFDKCVGVKILDLGCGTGLCFRLLRRHTTIFEYVGFDLSSGMLARFRDSIDPAELARVTLIHGNAKHACDLLPSSRFDLVLAANAAASFMGSPTQFLRQSRILLRPGGVLFASFLNARSLRRSIRGMGRPIEVFNSRGARPNLGGVHAMALSRKNLIRRCCRVGLTVIEVNYQSVFGGVAEGMAMLPIEGLFVRLLPLLGHTVNILATRDPD